MKKVCPSCGLNEATLPHTCPFKSEINWDDELCQCCEECQSTCEDEI
jgi:hypothetical protein